MSWIVIGEKGGKIELVSKDSVTGMLPKGSFLTIDEKDCKFILRVDDSSQTEPYHPSPLVVDMDLAPLTADKKCKNTVSASRLCDISKRTDGLIDYIRPQTVARKSTQEEIDTALGIIKEGPKVFIATAQYGHNQVLTDEAGKPITSVLPNDVFFHQTLICGKTGSGKTVAIKHLAQHFAEKFHGAVLAVNVKEADLLVLDKPSTSSNPEVLREWAALDEKPHGLENFFIYYPAISDITTSRGVTQEICKKISLSAEKIDPEALVGLLSNVTETGSLSLPGIYRYWQEEYSTASGNGRRFADFIAYFERGLSDNCEFTMLSMRGEQTRIKLHRATFDSLRRSLGVAVDFFDNTDAAVLDADDILINGQMSVIDVAYSGTEGKRFGSMLLRDLLHKIVQAKSTQRLQVPILIVIDEVHSFYSTNATEEALGDLDRICRTGRSLEIGIIFSSQDPRDIPPGLASVINTKIFFKTDMGAGKYVNLTAQEIESLKKGYSIATIHELPQVKIVKFPLALCGVIDK